MQHQKQMTNQSINWSSRKKDIHNLEDIERSPLSAKIFAPVKSTTKYTVVHCLPYHCVINFTPLKEWHLHDGQVTHKSICETCNIRNKWLTKPSTWVHAKIHSPTGKQKVRIRVFWNMPKQPTIFSMPTNRKYPHTQSTIESFYTIHCHCPRDNRVIL